MRAPLLLQLVRLYFADLLYLLPSDRFPLYEVYEEERDRIYRESFWGVFLLPAVSWVSEKPLGAPPFV